MEIGDEAPAFPGIEKRDINPDSASETPADYDFFKRHSRARYSVAIKITSDSLPDLRYVGP